MNEFPCPVSIIVVFLHKNSSSRNKIECCRSFHGNVKQYSSVFHDHNSLTYIGILRSHETKTFLTDYNNTRFCRDYCGIGLCPSPGILRNTAFWKMDLFISSYEEWATQTLLDPLERANLNPSTTYVSITTDNYTYIYTQDQGLLTGDSRKINSNNYDNVYTELKIR
jgi:hypothetical protein